MLAMSGMFHSLWGWLQYLMSLGYDITQISIL